MSQRLERVNALLKQEVAKLLSRELNFTDILVTVTEAKVSADLRYAKIKITVLPEEKSKLALSIIQKNIFHLQQKLNQKLHMKSVPKISFGIDLVEVKAQRLEEILSKLNKA